VGASGDWFFVKKREMGMNEIVLRVQDMSCGHCVATVKAALERVEGVEAVDVSLDSKLARVGYYGEIDSWALMAAVEAVGFTPEVQR
jgi:copper chaperone CopZ